MNESKLLHQLHHSIGQKLDSSFIMKNKGYDIVKMSKMTTVLYMTYSSLFPKEQ